MNAMRFNAALLAACLSLAAAEQASAFYAPHMGRFTSRDPNGETGRIGLETPPDAAAAAATFVDRDPYDPMTQYDDGMNLYQYVAGRPTIFTDPEGLWPYYPPHWPLPKPKPTPPTPPVGPVTPLPSNSPECDKYKCDDYYAGAGARCFCKCAGDSPWSNYVRGCLRKLYEQGVPPAEAHKRCYESADNQNFPGGRPWLKLAECYLACVSGPTPFPPSPDPMPPGYIPGWGP